NREWSYGLPNDEWSDRAKPKALADRSFQVLQGRQLPGFRGTAARHTPKFVRKPVHDFRMLRDLAQCPRKSQSRRIVTGDQNRDERVAHLPVPEWGSVLV